MAKQTLSIEQMQHLQELGLKLNYNTVLSWIVDERGKDKPLLCISSEAVDYVDFRHYCIPAYTLQDVLDALPKSLEIGKSKYEISIYMIGGKWAVDYYSEKDADIENLIDAVYSRLCWAIENGYVETNRNE